MLHHFTPVSQGDEFLELDAGTLEQILSEDNLRSETEEQVMKKNEPPGFKNITSPGARGRDSFL